MVLKSLDYKEFFDSKEKPIFNSEGDSAWSVTGLSYNPKFNLIVGENSTGKTRSINVINNLAKFIVGKKKFKNGEWNLTFNDQGKEFVYKISLKEGLITYEHIIFDNEVLLRRADNQVKLRNFVSNEDVEISPPDDSLVLQVRRDEKEYPYFEKLITWAKNTHGFTVLLSTNEVQIPSDSKDLESLASAVYFFDTFSDTSKDSVLRGLADIGYAIEKIHVEENLIKNIRVKLAEFKESSLPFRFNQLKISTGLMRLFGLLVALEYTILNSNNTGEDHLLLIDDIGEGLDITKSKNLIDLFKKRILENKHIQFIGASNDVTLLNTVDIEYWNITKRCGYEVKAFNIKNSKKKFDDFEFTGLNNTSLLNFIQDGS